MRKLTYYTMILAAAWIIQSCGGPNDSTEKADSINAEKADTTAVTDSAVVKAGMDVQESDAKFAVDAADGGMAEVALSKLALTKTSNEKVKEFANMMVTDHSKANDELMALAKTKNITLPATVSEDKQKEADDLAKKTGVDFDKAYVDAMVDGHSKTVAMFEDESKNAKDADIKAFVDKTLPALKMHKQHIEAMKAAMK